MRITEYMGKDGFHWFIGVVEDRNDPLKIGRVRVRAVGYHTSSKTILPTSDLPWASTMTATNSSGMSGLGTTPHFLVLGSHVVGFFRDSDCQEPVILGALMGKPSEYGNPNFGFADPTRRSDDDTQVDYNRSFYPKTPDESDVNELARGVEAATNPNFREGLRHKVIATAVREQFAVTDKDIQTITIDPSSGGAFSEPQVAKVGDVFGTYNPTYPLNHVFETETGHILEFDDTVGHSRINIFHNSGTYMEFSNNGTRVNHTTGDEFNTALNRNTFIKDNEVLTVNGSLKIIANADGKAGQNFDIQVDNNADLNIQIDKGNCNLNVKGNVNVLADGDYNVTAANIALDSKGKMLLNAKGNVDINGDPIDLN